MNYGTVLQVIYRYSINNIPHISTALFDPHILSFYKILDYDSLGYLIIT